MTFFKTLVVVRLNLDEWSKDVLVLICIFVSYLDVLWFIINSWFVEILQRSVRILAPEIFKAIDLRKRNLARAELFGFAGWFDKP